MNTLLLLHPTIVTEPQAVEAAKDSLAQKLGTDKSNISQHIIDRVATGQVSLRPSYYNHIQYLAPPEANVKKLPVKCYEIIFEALQSNGVFEGTIPPESATDGILQGFLVESDTKWVKPSTLGSVVSLKRPAGQNKTKSSAFKKEMPFFKKLSSPPTLTDSSEADEDEESQLNEKLKGSKLIYFDESSDDEIIDEDELLRDDDGALKCPVVVPVKCALPNGKRRKKACKDCTCGLKELEENEQNERLDAQASILSKLATSANAEAEKIEERLRRKQASKEGEEVKFTEQEVTEIDFTIQGKTGGCGSCALGDAFRCDGCPYLGLPPFKPGQAISIEGLGADI